MIRFAVASAAFLAVFFCLPAIAAQCAPASIMLPALERTGEKVIWQGIAGGHLVLLFQHPGKPAMDVRWNLAKENGVRCGPWQCRGAGHRAQGTS